MGHKEKKCYNRGLKEKKHYSSGDVKRKKHPSWDVPGKNLLWDIKGGKTSLMGPNEKNIPHGT